MCKPSPAPHREALTIRSLHSFICVSPARFNAAFSTLLSAHPSTSGHDFSATVSGHDLSLYSALPLCQGTTSVVPLLPHPTLGLQPLRERPLNREVPIEVPNLFNSTGPLLIMRNGLLSLYFLSVHVSGHDLNRAAVRPMCQGTTSVVPFTSTSFQKSIHAAKPRPRWTDPYPANFKTSAQQPIRPAPHHEKRAGFFVEIFIKNRKPNLKEET
jgi:hypothetical protein